MAGEAQGYRDRQEKIPVTKFIRDFSNSFLLITGFENFTFFGIAFFYSSFPEDSCMLSFVFILTFRLDQEEKLFFSL